mmetsp:Transcript_24350/g.78527  ORF Transcript_24350/g.78527 Transcript_24350/m.78527 type:complete len:212 (-) Transcript_24350:1298-1933(-)
MHDVSCASCASYRCTSTSHGAAAVMVMHATNPGRLCPHRFFLPLMRNERREIRAPAGTRPIATPANSPATGAMPPVGGIEGAGADGRLMEGTEGAEREGREREGAESFGAALAAVTAVCLREILAASRCALAFAFCSAAACSAAARATSFLLNGGGGGGGGSGGGGGGGLGEGGAGGSDVGAAVALSQLVKVKGRHFLHDELSHRRTAPRA